MILTQAKFEALLQDLRAQQTESPTVDGKAGLSLDTKGDHAYFIQQVAALANNVDPSHLIIGVEDKTWNPIGIPENSPLRNPDQTQQRMNHILENRLDPSLPVRYCTYEVSGVVYGLVVVEGTRAPYITAIPDQRYGGGRTQAALHYIYRGAIYVRHGANSVIANRQSEILEIVNKVQQRAIDNAQPDEFLTEHNYLNTESENFGHHSLSDCLVEAHLKENAPGVEFLPARSWVSFVFYSVDSDCKIGTVALNDKLKQPPGQRIWGGDEWYHWVPKPFIDMFYSARSTPKKFVGRRSPSRQNTEEITHFIHIRPSGHIEIGCTDRLFFQRDSVRCFGFVSLIGYLWQMVYLSKAIYHDAGFHGETAVLLNLVGTKGTRLADFARSQRGWASPFSFNYISSGQNICQDLNIQIERRLPLTESSDDEIETMIREIARDLGAYYGQDRPRSFDYHTDEFPYEDYRRACCR